MPLCVLSLFKSS